MSIALTLNAATAIALASTAPLTSLISLQIPGGFGGIESLSDNNNIANLSENVETASQLTVQSVLAKSQARRTGKEGKEGDEVINEGRIQTLDKASKLAWQRTFNGPVTFWDYVTNTYAPAAGVGALALASAACPPLALLLIPAAGLAAATGIKQQFVSSLADKLIKDVSSNPGTLSNNPKNAYFWKKLEQVLISEGKANGSESAALWLQTASTKEIRVSLGKALNFGDLVKSSFGAFTDATKIATSGFNGALA